MRNTTIAHVVNAATEIVAILVNTGTGVQADCDTVEGEFTLEVFDPAIHDADDDGLPDPEAEGVCLGTIPFQQKRVQLAAGCAIAAPGP